MNNKIDKLITFHDMMDPNRAAALHATLSLSGPPPMKGSSLEPFWHQIYFWDYQPPKNLGRDGHPKLGNFIPDLGLPRRMWAGGKVHFMHEIVLGIEAKKISTIKNVEKKIGKTGPLAFVTEQIDIIQNEKLCIQEYKKLVYRQEFQKDTQSFEYPITHEVADDEKQLSFTSTDLYRYSGLTFNGHRIHYDRKYSQDIEGYPGLVVHGPLLAQCLINFAKEILGSIKKFEFRGESPLFDFEDAILCRKLTKDGVELWVKNSNNKLCMSALAI
ncbi:MAG: acyl dehydratase [Paracoccaceae bacterium]|nr:acyl dehydratase [Paracoccaceae bacterium]|tara:strand:- start:6752 stop:7567 length:816 start_codon:yes stop_codon:yes gene_type:complete